MHVYIYIYVYIYAYSSSFSFLRFSIDLLLAFLLVSKHVSISGPLYPDVLSAPLLAAPADGCRPHDRVAVRAVPRPSAVGWLWATRLAKAAAFGDLVEEEPFALTGLFFVLPGLPLDLPTVTTS